MRERERERESELTSVGPWHVLPSSVRLLLVCVLLSIHHDAAAAGGGYTLWLHPAPDVLVLADRQQQYQHTYSETLAFNPGAFASDLSWMVYRPSAKEAEASSLEM